MSAIDDIRQQIEDGRRFQYFEPGCLRLAILELDERLRKVEQLASTPSVNIFDWQLTDNDMRSIEQMVSDGMKARNAIARQEKPE